MKDKREHLSKCNGEPPYQAEDFREPHCLHYNSNKKHTHTKFIALQVYSKP